jgi:hypothetical protein
MVRIAFSYARLFFACWVLMGGAAMQLNPSPAAVARDVRWREHKLETIAPDRRAKWIEDQDIEDANARAYLRICGVMLGGAGLAMALRETAYLNARYSR